MKRDTLAKANELEKQVEYYNQIIHAMTYPWQRFKLCDKTSYIGASKHPYNVEITLNDQDLAKLIENYCRKKVESLNAELEAL